MMDARKRIAVRCRCGEVRGEAEVARAYARLTCYCRDCQAYARWLGLPDMMDARGGTDIVAMAPSGLRFSQGRARIACITLSGRVFRWYADCCRTPLGNTSRSPRLHYVGMCTACMPDAPALDATFGPGGRCVVHADSAIAPVRPTPVAFAFAALSIARGVSWARLRRLRSSPFFDETTGRPIRTPVTGGEAPG